jgi:uncharacterized SAM-binding protein YcdF (DUF218 family)
MRRPERPRRRPFPTIVLILCAALLLFALTVYLLRQQILTAAGVALVEDDGPQKADCILVLGGDAFGFRIVKAAQLAGMGYAPYVLVDGPKSLIGYESDAEIKYAVMRGYPASLFRAVPLPPEINSTSAEAEYVANNVLRPQGIRKILLVTSNYHTRRAARCIRGTAPWLTVAVVPAPDLNFTVNGWWKSREGKKTFLLEWTKTISEWLGE